MKKKSIKSMAALLIICCITFFSCNNSQSGSKAKLNIAKLNSCLSDCAAKEKACWDEYEKCKSKAYAEEQTALNVCNHLPPANQWVCKSKAVGDCRAKIEQCERNLKACLGSLSSCREACVSQLSFEQDNTR